MKRLLLQFIIILSLATLCTMQAWGQTATTITPTQPTAGDGSSGNPYQISSAAELYWFAALVNGTLTDGTSKNVAACARLTADITLNSGTFSYSKETKQEYGTDYYNYTISYNGNAIAGIFENGSFSGEVEESHKPLEWKPLGNDNSGYQYTGTFDGQGHTITGLYVNATGYAGFVGYANGCTIQNLKLVKACMLNTGESWSSGAICGRSLGADKIDNCSFDGLMVSKSSSIGGICGQISNNGTVTNCHAKGEIIGCSFSGGSGVQSIGGIVGETGYQNDNARIENCYSEAVIFSNRNGGLSVGGICGYLQKGSIICCYNTGALTATQDRSKLGGVCGALGNSATGYNPVILRCYNTATVSCTSTSASSSDYRVGGLCGQVYSGFIQNSYSTGGVEGTYRGSFLGKYEKGTISNCYAQSIENVNLVYDGTATGIVGATAAKFSSGLVAYKLGDGWGQMLKGTKAESLPLLNGQKVYQNGNDYDNLQLTTLNSEQYCQLNSASDLQFFALRFNNSSEYGALATQNACLSADIDLNPGITFDASGNPTGGTPTAWTPIGTGDAPYTGTFDGQKHLIKGLYANGGTDAAFIHTIGSGTGGSNGTGNGNGSTVQNLGITTGSISGATAAAGAICVQNNGTIKNSYSLIPVSGSGSGSAGGLCGTNAGTIAYSFTTQPTLYATTGGTGTPTVTNSYSLQPDGQTETAEARHADFFKSGEMTWKLNGETADASTSLTWQQRIQPLSEGGDAHPSFYGGTNNLRVIRISLNNKLTSEDGTGTTSYYMNPAGYTLPTIASEAIKNGDKTKTGHVPGWSSTAGGIYAYNITQTVENDLTLYESWIANHYTLVFHANNGSEPESTSRQSFVYTVPQTLTANAFTRTGYVFKQWTTAADGTGTVYTDKQEEVKDLTPDVDGTFDLYAQWTPNTYTVHFDPNRPQSLTGTGTMADQSFTYDAEQALTVNTFTCQGRTFTGWSASSTATDPTYTETGTAETGITGAKVKNLTFAVNGSVTLYAVWRQQALIIVFDANREEDLSEEGQTEEMSNQNFISGESKTLTQNAYTRQGYTFGGWKTTPKGTEATYADQQSVTLQAAHEGEERTFYAHWIPKQYTVTVKSESIKKGGISLFDENGAQLSGSSYTTDYRNEILLKAIPRAGYKFSQWSDGNTEEERVFQVPLNGATLTALFAEETQTVTIQTGSGSQDVQIGKDGSGLAEALAQTPNSIAIIDASLGITIPAGLSNVILKSGSSMGTCTKLELTDQAAFSTPVKFTAEEVVYTRNLNGYTYANGTDGWSTLVVPFSGDLYADNAKLTPFSSNSDTNGHYWLKAYTGGTAGETLSFAYATKIEANKPYIIALPGDAWGQEHSLTGKAITVRAADATIYASPTPKESVGGDYSFTGTYDGIPSSTYYQLNAAGNTFEKNSGAVDPFRCYLALLNNALAASAPMAFSIGDENGTVTGIGSAPAADGSKLRIYAHGGNILIEAPAATTVSIYSIDGRLVRTVQVKEGVNTVSGLSRGFYIVERQKIVLE